MSRSRNIKPGFFLNDTLCSLPPLARLLFAGLWTVCDREGRTLDRPLRIKAEVLPYDDCDVDDMLRMLAESGFIHRYVVDGVQVLQVSTWGKHQNPHVKEQASTLPAPDKHQTSTVHEQGKHVNGTSVAGLIPDSGFLIPDSLIPDSTSIPPVIKPPGQADPSVTVAGAWAIDLKRRGIQVTSMHPTMLAWIEDGFTIPQVIEALQIARDHKPEPQPIHPNYLDTILRNPPKKQEPQWWTDDVQITAKAKEFGVSTYGKQREQLKTEIFAAIKAARSTGSIEGMMKEARA